MIILVKLLQLLSRLPLGVLYAISTCCYPLIYYVVRYRRHVVRTNIENSFPEKTTAEKRKIERDFYRFFCDYAVETVKLLTMSEGEMRKRMIIEGMDDIEKSLQHNPFVFIYLGHYCNWEWISSIPLWRKSDYYCGQLYRPLKDKVMDDMFYQLRTRFYSHNISKYDAFRHIITLKKEKTQAVIGFISDQSPRPNNIHDWVNFLHQETPVFTGTERIAKKVNAAIYFADVQRIKRGYYHLRMYLLTEDVKSYPDFQVTDLYMQALEKNIQRQPHLWLWSHKRWKHRRKEVEEMQSHMAKKEENANEVMEKKS